MAKEIARFQLTSGSNNLERWLIDDDASLIYDNTDSTKYVSISSRNYYNSAFFNFSSSVYGYLFSSGFLLCDKATKVYRQRSTDGGTTWSDYSQTSSMVSTYGTVYTLSNPDTNIGGTYVINLNCNDAQCISSIAPLFTIADGYNNYVSNVYAPWEIVKSLIVGNNTYTWDFPTDLENAILATIENYGSPYIIPEITSFVPGHSMHDFDIVDYPFTLHKGSDGSWQGGTSYTIGLGTYSVPAQEQDGIYYNLSDSTRVGVASIGNTNGTMVVFFVKNEVTHQAAIMKVMSAWYLSSDMNRIHLYGYGTPQAKYEQVYNDLIGAIPVPSTWEVVTNLGGYTCSVLTGYTSPEDVPFQINDDVLVLGNTPSALTGAGSSEWVINQDLKAVIALTSTGMRNDGSLHMPADSTTSIAGWAGAAYMGSKADFVFFINEATEEGDAFFVSYLSQVGAAICNYRVNQIYRHDLYLALKNSMPTAYNWTPLESITGKLGTFDLSQIGTINYGNPVSGATIDDIAEIEPSTELSTLAEGCDVETPIIYSDRFNYISIKDNGDNTCNLKFYYRGSPIYSLMGISQNAYLSMLIDSENEVLKPSIIYSTDATHYSYNQETPTDDEMLALYRWLTANAQLEEFEAYRYHDENGVEIVLEDKGDTETGFYEEVSYAKV